MAWTGNLREQVEAEFSCFYEKQASERDIFVYNKILRTEEYRKDYNKSYSFYHRQEKAATSRAWRAKNRERHFSSVKEWRSKNKEKVNEYQRSCRRKRKQEASICQMSLVLI